MTSASSTRRIALVADAGFYVGPDIGRLLAARGHDLVLGDPADGLVEEFANLVAYVERGKARPAYQRAYADQHAVFAALPKD